MTVAWSSGKTVVMHLRVKGSGLDPLLTQLRLADLLNRVDVHPAGLPPAAILCIRSLHDPKPGALRLQNGDGRATLAWEQAVTQTIDQLARQAVRPLHGAVPASAEAVLFADRAELLACLAMDWCASVAWAHWWWQGLFRNTDIARAVLTAWLDAIAYVPAALHHLAVQEQAVAFAGRLNDDTAYQLRQATVRAFGLPELHSALSEASREDATKRETTVPWRGARPGQARPFPGLWQRWVPEAGQGELRVEQQCLLGIGLMLDRAPSAVRTPTFARTAAEWYSAARSVSLPLASKEETPAIRRPAMVTRSPGLPPAGRVQYGATPVAQTIPAPPETPESEQSRQYAESDEAPRHTPDGRADTERERMQAYSESSLVGASAAAVGTDHASRYEVPPPNGPEGELNAIAFASASQVEVTTKIDEVAFDYEIDTEFGGIFYLINLGLFLNLYGDFTTPLTPGLALSIWDFVALVGQALVGERLRADPAWKLLARLAERDEDELPGKGFEPPDDWRVPTDWLAPFPEQAVWQWSHDGERLRVQHPAGFCLIDIAVEAGDHIEQLRQALHAYAGTAEFETEQASEVFAHFRGLTGLNRWLHWFVPYIPARLRRALGVDEADVPRVVCEQHAHVTVTATNFDIYLELAELPIEVRLAGLDRDPGWVPAAGRFVEFHYE